MLSRIQLFEKIRRDRRLEPDVSQRELGRRYNVHRRTVRAALESAIPPPRKKPARTRLRAVDPAAIWIDAMLREDLTAPRKQRHTIQRIHDRLRLERNFTDASYSSVRNYVNRRRPEILAEFREGHVHADGVVPQVHEPGAEAEVDFADVWVRLAGEPMKCHLFTLRLSYSGKAVHRIYASQSQEAFMQGHVEAFAVLGGVPVRHIRYDNLKPAIKQVCFGRSRVESQRWTAFRSHYGYDAFYCIPGKEGAHEKGGVEREGGRFRRTHLVPVPEVDTLAELNDRLAAIDRAEDGRHVHGRNVSIGASFAAERDLLNPLPGEDFDCGITLTPTVRRDSRIVIRQCYYSVPARFIGRQVRVSLRANELLVFDRNEVRRTSSLSHLLTVSIVMCDNGDMVAMKSYRANEARLQMREILTAVERGEHIQIQRYDTPTAIVVPIAWWRNMLAIKRGLLLFTRDSETCHQLPGETEKPIGELLAAIGNDALCVLDEEPDLGDER